MRDCEICQVHVDTRHVPAADGVDLSTILAQTVGSLFADMATNAAFWQRVRGSKPVETVGVPVTPPADGAPADTTPMLETFQLGFRNLQEVWSLVLPPVTLLELKRLARPSTTASTCPTSSGYASSTTSRWPTGCVPSAAPICWGAHAAVPGLGSLVCAGSRQRQPGGGRTKAGEAGSRL